MSYIFTVNQRLARRLTAQFLKTQPGTVFETPKIQAFTDYVQAQCQQEQCLKHLPILLNTAQQCLLWQQIISESESELALLNPVATAKTVHKAYRALEQWNLKHEDLPADTAETRYFKQWAEQFESKLDELGAMTEGRFIEQLSPPETDTIMLIGFDDIPPLTQACLDRWSESGINIMRQNGTPKAQCHQLPTVSSQQTLIQAAFWAKAELSQNPKAKLAVVVPDLQAQRDEIIDAFQTVLAPNQIEQSDTLITQFAITGGEPLSQFAPISHAIALWKSLHHFNREEVLTVLRSPYFNTRTNDHLDQALQVFPHHWKDIPQHAEALEDFCSKVSRFSTQGSHPIKHWTQSLQHLLQMIGWPGEVTLNSEEHQAITRFYRAMDDIQTLNVVMPELTFEQALDLIAQQLNELTFQAESESAPAIEILGVLEAGGLAFDQIFMTGLNHHQWPLTAKPNPYLPIELQREHNMPHASADRELSFAQSVMQQLASQCDVLIAAYAQFEGDTALKPSALIEDWPLVEGTPVHDNLLFQQHQAAPELEQLTDHQAPPITDTENLQSGLQIFKRQALCPFQAFAALRLNLADWEDPPEPLNLAFRGSVLHRLLETVWGKLQTQARLNEISESELDALITDLTTDAIQNIKRYQPTAMPAYLQALEQKRLVKLTKSWLELEKSREPFKVLAEEKAMFGHIAGIPLKVRVDRIDQCGDEQLVLDYKTGFASRLNWYDERPAEPQMPIYALLTGAAGIAYAKVKPDDIRIDGVGGSELVEGITAVADDRYTACNSWSALKSHWQKVFQQLADNFLSGDASVDPKSPEAACRYCDFKRLCRVQMKE